MTSPKGSSSVNTATSVMAIHDFCFGPMLILIHCIPIGNSCRRCFMSTSPFLKSCTDVKSLQDALFVFSIFKNFVDISKLPNNNRSRIWKILNPSAETIYRGYKQHVKGNELSCRNNGVGIWKKEKRNKTTTNLQSTALKSEAYRQFICGLFIIIFLPKKRNCWMHKYPDYTGEQIHNSGKLKINLRIYLDE